ncbi:hypothetical protein RLOC_00013659 [Lonchura striata]|uniref:Uncharacterized protein n=1 Tax=Lonchura striata TaxID=40157 RepID=A0A218V5W3_9PASE|nr:hypothetical protein RLOC_00013659 [Lonchura striata domestica]
MSPLHLKEVVSISRTSDLRSSRRLPQRDSGSRRAGEPGCPALPRERRGTPRWDGGTVRPRLSRDFLPPSFSRQDILRVSSPWNGPDPSPGGTFVSVEKPESCLYEVLSAGTFSKMFVYATHQLDFQHNIVLKEKYPVL